MATVEQGTVGSVVDDIAPALRSEIDQLDAERVELNKRMMTVEAEIKRRRRILGIIDPDAPDVIRAPGRQPGVKTKKPSNPSSVAAWREDEVVRVLGDNPDGLTNKQLAEVLGWKIEVTRIAAKQARDKELIRKAGMNGMQPIWKAYDGS